MKDKQICCLALDIGGTKIEMGYFDPSGRNLGETRKYPVPFGADGEADADGMIALLNKFIRETGNYGKTLAGLGVGICGRVEENSGVVVLAPNLHWRRKPLRDILQDAFNLPAVVAVDTQQAAMAEMAWGAAQGMRNFAWVTLGTGCGSSYILNGKPYGGTHGFAGEIGHISIDEINGFPCGCGRRGCLETFIAGPAIARQGQAAVDKGAGSRMAELTGGSPVTPEIVVRASQSGDPAARQIIEDVLRICAMAMGGLANTLDLQMIVMGGGVVRSIPDFIDQLQTRIRPFLIFEESKKELRIVRETFVNAALNGAAADFFAQEVEND